MRTTKPDSGRVVSVNVGRPRAFAHQGGMARSAIWKSPVRGRVAVRGVNVEGDDQADRKLHGGVDKAVYAYACEDARYWETELGRALPAGFFGENLTLEGVDITRAVVGERWQIGTAELEVSEPRGPCWKLAHKVGDPRFVKRFTKAGRSGAYLRIALEGEIGEGDAVVVLHRPGHGVSIGEVFQVYAGGHGDVARLLDASELSESWRAWAEKRLTDR